MTRVEEMKLNGAYQLKDNHIVVIEEINPFCAYARILQGPLKGKRCRVLPQDIFHEVNAALYVPGYIRRVFSKDSP